MYRDLFRLPLVENRHQIAGTLGVGCDYSRELRNSESRNGSALHGEDVVDVQSCRCIDSHFAVLAAQPPT